MIIVLVDATEEVSSPNLPSVQVTSVLSRHLPESHAPNDVRTYYTLIANNTKQDRNTISKLLNHQLSDRFPHCYHFNPLAGALSSF